MAVYKRDMVDINLETGNIHRSFLKHSIGYKDAAADHFGIRVFRNGEPVSLTGVSVQGIFMPPQGDPIAITSGNIVSENEAEVVLPQACYNYDGQFTLSIKLVDATNAVTGTMRIVDGMVDNTHASGTVAPTSAVPTYQEILATYDAMVAATTAATTAATNVGSIVAAAYSTSATYAVGDYCTKDGNLYRCTTAITTAESWTAAHWTQTKMGPDVSDLKSALDYTDDATGVIQWFPGNTTLAAVPSSTTVTSVGVKNEGNVITIDGTCAISTLRIQITKKLQRANDGSGLIASVGELLPLKNGHKYRMDFNYISGSLPSGKSLLVILRDSANTDIASVKADKTYTEIEWKSNSGGYIFVYSTDVENGTFSNYKFSITITDISTLSSVQDDVNTLNTELIGYSIARGLFYSDTAVNSSANYADSTTRCASVPIGLDNYDIIVESTTENIVAYFSDGTSTGTWVKKVTIPKGKTAKMMLKDYDSPSGAAKAVLIDNLTLYMSDEAYKEFFKKYYYTYEEILNSTPSSVVENGWVVASNADKLGMLSQYGTLTGYRRTKKPIVFNAGSVSIYAMNADGKMCVLCGKQVITANSGLSASLSVNDGDAFIGAVNTNSNLLRISFVETADADMLPIISKWKLLSLSHRVDCATIYNGNIYTLSNADSGDSTIRIYDSSMTLLYTLQQDASHVGHANSQSLVGDYWYISDSGISTNDPKIVHVYKLDGADTVYVKDLTFNTDLNMNNYIFENDITNVYSVGVKRYEEGGPLENIEVIVGKWVLNTTTGDYDYACEIMKCPRFGYWQGLCKMGKYIYSPISSVEDYDCIGIAQIDLETSSINIVSLGTSTLVNEEAEGIIPLDKNNAIIYAVSGSMYFAKLNNQK